MPRKILLLEPNYKNKYPPIGLMKIATYHKTIGDNVRFFKGNINTFIAEAKVGACLLKLKEIDEKYDWELEKDHIIRYFISRKISALEKILVKIDSNFSDIVESALRFYCYKFSPEVYDRIYVTTLFTFYWDITVKTIKQSKKLIKNEKEIFVGGVMASLLTDEIEIETGIKPFKGLLNKPGLLDYGNKLIVDELNLDYSILDEIEYEYPTGSAYFTFMTKGCTRKCKFCSVPILEPVYKDKVSATENFAAIGEIYGDQKNLLLMDNNVLASPKFPEIVQEIKEMGFAKGAKYIEPNQLNIAITNLKNDANDFAFLNRTHKIIIRFYNCRVKGETKKIVGDIFHKYKLFDREKLTKQNVLDSYKELDEIYEKHRNKSAVNRYVDFNQGIDGRYVTDENMKLLSEINVRPLRIAFDFVGMAKQYINAVELAAKYGIKNLSNYLLYNFKDKPEDLYERMRINIELNRKYDLKIFSFPMKYIPLFGEEAKGRKHISKKWNKKFIRAIQSILNVSKGIVAPGGDFFEMAFGKDLEEFKELLYMPEALIIYRNKFKEVGITQEWREKINSLTALELVEAKAIIEANEFTGIENKTTNTRIFNLLQYYTLSPKDIGVTDFHFRKLRTKINDLMREDEFLELTLTYDYDSIKPIKKVV